MNVVDRPRTGFTNKEFEKLVRSGGLGDIRLELRRGMLVRRGDPGTRPSKFTNHEFERLVDAGAFGRAQVELLRGTIQKMNPQHVPHARIKRLLAEAINAGLQHAGLRWIVDQEVSVDVAEGFEPAPDIVVWDPTSAPPNLTGPVPGTAVRLVVEVASTTLADDLGEMLEDFAAGRVTEYWVADLKGRMILRHAGPTGSTYAQREPVRFGEAFAWLTQKTLQVDTSSLA